MLFCSTSRSTFECKDFYNLYCTRGWVNNFSQVEEIGYLDYQIIQWQKSIPAELQLPTTADPKSSSRALHRLQILLYLRANQMRILIYRPVLHSASSIQENMSYANIVVELAKDTIRALTHLNQTTDIYRMQQVLFNYFLISAYVTASDLTEAQLTFPQTSSNLSCKLSRPCAFQLSLSLRVLHGARSRERLQQQIMG